MNRSITRKVERATDRYEKKKRQMKRAVRRHHLLPLGFGLLTAFFSIFIMNGLNTFYNKYELYVRSPIQNPFVLREKPLPTPNVRIKVVTPTPTRRPTATPSPTPYFYRRPSGKAAEPALAKLQERFYLTIRNNESSNGRVTGLNAYCHNKGMINEIGYAPHESWCFKDAEEQKDTAFLWLKNRYGKDCVKRGYCRETIGELLALYSSNAYNTLLAEK